MIKRTYFMIVIIGLLTHSAFAIQPYPGEWKATGEGKFGNDSTGFIIFEFSISNDSKYLTIKTDGIVVFRIGGKGALYKPAQDQIVKMENDGFKWSGYGGYSIEGVFDSEKSAIGKWHIDKFLDLSAGFFQVDGTWTALYVGSETSISSKGKLATTWGKIKSKSQ